MMIMDRAPTWCPNCGFELEPGAPTCQHCKASWYIVPALVLRQIFSFYSAIMLITRYNQQSKYQQ